MNTTSNHNARISSMVDGDMTDEEFASVYALLKEGGDEQILATRATWDMYHQIGDVLRSDELDLRLSDSFSTKMAHLLEQEPSILVPNVNVSAKDSDTKTDKDTQVALAEIALKGNKSRYMAMTSIAAAVMVAFVMTPQILPLLGNKVQNNVQAVQTAPTKEFQVPAVQLANNRESSEQLTEFAPSLANQVELLRDPNLDSYLMAHQKASPAFANNGRYVKKANIDTSHSNNSEK